MTFAPRDWAGSPGFIDEGYKSTALRGPKQKLIPLPQGPGETSGPAYGRELVGAAGSDLTRNGRVNGEPLGERITVSGRVLDEFGRPLRNTLVEIWQANAAGRYVHKVDQHNAPLDPNFLGAGHCATDEEGRYKFLTIKPGAYSWRNHFNAWRPNHIHFSLFGAGFASRLVTQMYFPGRSAHAVRSDLQQRAGACPRAHGVALRPRRDGARIRPRLRLRYRASRAKRDAVRNVKPRPNLLPQTPSQTVGPFFAFALTGKDYGSHFPQIADGRIARDNTPGTRIRIVGRVLDGAGEPVPDAMIEIWQADAAGRYAGAADFADPAAFHGFGRIGTGARPDASFVIETIKPGGPTVARRRTSTSSS